MKLERLVASLELSIELKELGVRQESLFCWMKNPTGTTLKLPEYSIGQHCRNYRILQDREGYDNYSAFTSGELGLALPWEIESESIVWTINFYKFKSGEIQCVYRTICEGGYEFLIEVCEFTEADARAKMLIYLIKNKIITVEEVNERLSK